MSNASHHEDGFTLIELLVSLAILAVALGVLFNAISGSLDRTRYSRDAMLATSLVQSLLTRAGTERPLHQGIAAGTYSNGFHWQLLVQPFGNDDDRKAWQASAYVVRATASWREHGRTQFRTLSTLRIVPPEKAS